MYFCSGKPMHFSSGVDTLESLALELAKVTRPRKMAPRLPMITANLKSSVVAKREIMPGVEHRQDKSLNNRAENSHQPT
jgi:transposase-like protein